MPIHYALKRISPDNTSDTEFLGNGMIRLFGFPFESLFVLVDNFKRDFMAVLDSRVWNND